MNPLLLIAQSGIGEISSALFVYGPMGVMLAWFMWRFEALLKEIRTMSHRFDGMTRAILVDVVSRETSPIVRQTAQDMLTKIAARDSAESRR